MQDEIGSERPHWGVASGPHGGKQGMVRSQPHRGYFRPVQYTDSKCRPRPLIYTDSRCIAARPVKYTIGLGPTKFQWVVSIFEGKELGTFVKLIMHKITISHNKINNS